MLITAAERVLLHLLPLWNAKDAVVDQFREKTGKRPSVDLERPSLRIVVSLFQDEAQLSAAQLVQDHRLERVDEANSRHGQPASEFDIVRGHRPLDRDAPLLLPALELPGPSAAAGRGAHAYAVVLEQVGRLLGDHPGAGPRHAGRQQQQRGELQPGQEHGSRHSFHRATAGAAGREC